MNTDVTTALSLTAQVAAALLAISITLVALVPAVTEIARAHSETFFSAEMARRRLRKAVSGIRRTIWLFGLSIAVSIYGVLFPSWALLVIADASFLGATVILLYECNALAQITSGTMQ